MFTPFVAKPLHLIFQQCLIQGVFSKIWKLANVQPVYKKGSREIKSNYKPISLLPICGKMWKKMFTMNSILF